MHNRRMQLVPNQHRTHRPVVASDRETKLDRVLCKVENEKGRHPAQIPGTEKAGIKLLEQPQLTYGGVGQLE